MQRPRPAKLGSGGAFAESIVNRGSGPFDHDGTYPSAIAHRFFPADSLTDLSRLLARGRIMKHGGIALLPLRGLSALLLLGGIVYALVSGSLGIGAIAFGLGAGVLGLERLRAARGRPGRAIGWVLVLCGAFVVVDALIWLSTGGP
jgi:hypothetical protein